jgi:hypothetical protein
MREVCRNPRNLTLLESWLSVYTGKVNTGVRLVDVAAQVSLRKEKREAKVCIDGGMQTEGKIESAVRKEQSNVGTQTNTQTDGEMLAKRKRISPNVDSLASRMKP